jgi:hypothetical protein
VQQLTKKHELVCIGPIGRNKVLRWNSAFASKRAESRLIDKQLSNEGSRSYDRLFTPVFFKNGRHIQPYMNTAGWVGSCCCDVVVVGQEPHDQRNSRPRIRYTNAELAKSSEPVKLGNQRGLQECTRAAVRRLSPETEWNCAPSLGGFSLHMEKSFKSD